MKLLNNYHLKLIAMTLMTIDHIGYIFELNLIYRIIGRLSFPLFAFLIYQGYVHTKNRIKYLLRLMIFGLSIELILIIIKLFIQIENIPRNIFMTLSFGLMGLTIIGSKQNILLKIILISLLSYISEILYFDYGFYGILIIISFYFLKYNILITMLIQILINYIFYIYYDFDIQYFSLLSLLIIAIYSGKLGNRIKHKSLFYLYYPLHLSILFLIKIYLLPT